MKHPLLDLADNVAAQRKAKKEKPDNYPWARPSVAGITPVVSRFYLGMDVELAVMHALGMVRELFKERGNKVEAHLTESEVATMLAIAVQRGYIMGRNMKGNKK